MRFYRTDEMDLLANQPLPFRSDRLRAHVDSLPEPERQIISRLYFGGDVTTRLLAEELGLEERQVKSCLKNALQLLKARVLEDHPEEVLEGP